jgi:hypothetical protein
MAVVIDEVYTASTTALKACSVWLFTRPPGRRARLRYVFHLQREPVEPVAKVEVRRYTYDAAKGTLVARSHHRCRPTTTTALDDCDRADQKLHLSRGDNGSNGSRTCNHSSARASTARRSRPAIGLNFEGKICARTSTARFLLTILF